MPTLNDSSPCDTLGYNMSPATHVSVGGCLAPQLYRRHYRSEYLIHYVVNVKILKVMLSPNFLCPVDMAFA